LPATERISAHCESYSPTWSSTIRTARSRTSGENGDGLVMTPSCQDQESPGKPGRFTRRGHRACQSVTFPVLLETVILYPVVTVQRML
jgi:hypothetical protein